MIINENSKAYLVGKLKEIRESIPCSMQDQADDIGVNIHTLRSWIEDFECKTPLRFVNVRKVKDYIERHKGYK